MDLKELVKLDETTGKSFYGVEVSSYVTSTIPDLAEIGFVAVYNEEGNYLSDDLLDTILDYKNTSAKVIVEIPYSRNTPVEAMHHLAQSVKVDVSYQPPSESEDLEVYASQLVRATELWVSNETADFVVYPPSGYFHYMIQEVFNGTNRERISTDSYMIENFVSTMSVEDMDAVKDKLRPVFIDAFGGQEQFEIFAHSTARAIADAVEDISSHIIENSDK